MRTTLIRLSVLSLPVFALLACSALTNEPIAQSSAAILGGVVDVYDAPVGAIVGQTQPTEPVVGVDAGPQIFIFRCNAVLITPDFVLTPIDFPDINNATFATGTGTDGASSAAASGLHLHVIDTDISLAPDDAGNPAPFFLMHLKTPIANITPLWLTGDAVGLPTTTTLRAVGYGAYDSGTGVFQLERHSLVFPVGTVTGADVTLDPATETALQGDIGSPVFSAGTLVGFVNAARGSVAVVNGLSPWVPQIQAAMSELNALNHDPATPLGPRRPVEVSAGYVTVAPGPGGAQTVVATSTLAAWAPNALLGFTINPASIPAGLHVSIVSYGVDPPTATIQVVADEAAAQGTQASAEVDVTDGQTTAAITFEIVVSGACAPLTTCASPNILCGTKSDGCGSTLICGCPRGDECNSKGICAAPATPCKAPTHECGGYCAVLCTQ